MDKGNPDFIRRKGHNVAAGEAFSIRVEERDGCTDLFLAGDLDVAAAPTFRDTLQRLVVQGQQNVVIDLTGLTFLGSSGLGVLVGGLKRLRSKGGDLKLRGVPRQARRVLELTELIKIFEIESPVGQVSGRGLVNLRESQVSGA